MNTVFLLIVVSWEICGIRSATPCTRVYERGEYATEQQCEQAAKGANLLESARGKPRENFACVKVLGREEKVN